MSTLALQIKNISKSFGGVSAVDQVSFDLVQGQLTALIGPNGAGKTTLFNLITNFFKPDSGEVLLFGQSLSGHTPGVIATMGMLRTFQSARIFPGMTALENTLVGAHLQIQESPLAQMLSLPKVRSHEKQLTLRAEALLDLVGLLVSATHPQLIYPWERKRYSK